MLLDKIEKKYKNYKYGLKINYNLISNMRKKVK